MRSPPRTRPGSGRGGAGPVDARPCRSSSRHPIVQASGGGGHRLGPRPGPLITRATARRTPGRGRRAPERVLAPTGRPGAEHHQRDDGAPVTSARYAAPLRERVRSPAPRLPSGKNPTLWVLEHVRQARIARRSVGAVERIWPLLEEAAEPRVEDLPLGQRVHRPRSEDGQQRAVDDAGVVGRDDHRALRRTWSKRCRARRSDGGSATGTPGGAVQQPGRRWRAGSGCGADRRRSPTRRLDQADDQVDHLVQGVRRGVEVVGPSAMVNGEAVRVESIRSRASSDDSVAATSAALLGGPARARAAGSAVR